MRWRPARCSSRPCSHSKFPIACSRLCDTCGATAGAFAGALDCLVNHVLTHPLLQVWCLLWCPHGKVRLGLTRTLRPSLPCGEGMASPLGLVSTCGETRVHVLAQNKRLTQAGRSASHARGSGTYRALFGHAPAR